jgi:hypothetical protein
LIANPVRERIDFIVDNQKHLSDSRAHIRQFEAEMEPERLREAYMDLENVVLPDQHNPRARAQLRGECLALWLRLLDVLDRFLDPSFNPDDPPELRVEPPPTRDGIEYPGMDPALIEDPRARAEYERAIAANNQKAIRYRLQIQLGRLKDLIPAGVVAFVYNSYSADAGDQTEVRTAIDNVIKNPQRKAELLRLTAPAHR